MNMILHVMTWMNMWVQMSNKMIRNNTENTDPIKINNTNANINPPQYDSNDE